MKVKPGGLTAVGIIWIVDGMLSIGWGFGLVMGAFASIVGVVCLPLTALPFVVGLLELIYGIRLSMNPPSVNKPPIFISILEIILILYLDVLGLAAGIATLVLLNQEEVKEYFSQTTS